MRIGSWRITGATGTALSRARLGFELLERRDLLAVMRIVDWNTLNGPNDPAGDANYQTVLQAIGNETVQGNTQRIDILALQETDPNLPGVTGSIERIGNILERAVSDRKLSVRRIESRRRRG